MKTRNLITVIIAILAGLAIAAWFYQSRINAQLTEAKQQTAVAKADLQRIKGVADYRKAELDKVTAKADQKIEAANKRLAELQHQAVVKKNLITQLKADNERLNAQLLATINLPIEEPLPPDELLSKAEQLYFPRTFTDSSYAMFPADLVQTMLREIEQRRELDYSNSKLITEQDLQIANLEAAISEQESRYFGLQAKFDTQSELVTSLEDEIAQYDQLVATLNKQIGLYERKFNLNWMYKVVVPLALATGLYLGCVK